MPRAMLRLVSECVLAGKAAAWALYGMPGWVTHHDTELWRFSALAGEDAPWAWWDLPILDVPAPLDTL